MRSGTSSNPHLPQQSFTTGAHGIRMNDAVVKPLAQGGMLAVGDSFTAGSEVGDTETWPAILERQMGEPVVNAGMGGWATDQIVLRAEELVGLLSPHTLIVSFLDQDILRAGFRVFGGGNKPWFSVREGKLQHHNDPVPVAAASPKIQEIQPLGYIYLLTWMLERLGYGGWWQQSNARFLKADNDPAEVTCALLGRLKKQVDELNTRMLLVLQYGGHQNLSGMQQNTSAVEVADCARSSGIETLDTWGQLQRLNKYNLSAYRRMYVLHDSGRVFGHMSPAGNAFIATSIAARLRVAREGHGAGSVARPGKLE